MKTSKVINFIFGENLIEDIFINTLRKAGVILITRDDYNLKCVKTNNLIYFKLLFKKHFFKSFKYRDNLYEEPSLKIFIKRHLLLLALTLLVPIVALFICFLIEDDVKLFELVSVLVTYLCTTFLALLVYFNSWKQDKRTRFSEGIHVEAAPVFKYKEDEKNNLILLEENEIDSDCQGRLYINGGFETQSEDVGFLGINVVNLNVENPIKISMFANYILNDKKEIEKLPSIVKLNTFDYSWINSTGCAKFYFSLPKNIINKHNDFITISCFEINNIKNESVYYIVEYQFGPGYFAPVGTLIEKKTFDDLIEKHGESVIKSINTKVKIRKRIFEEVDYLNEIKFRYLTI